MFGYIVCNKSELTKEQVERYQSFYCGLCFALKKRYGQLERIGLNYDMVFLAIMLNGLYEAPEQSRMSRCLVHPFKESLVTDNQYIDYAADMTILLTYYKCLDDWNDERKHTSRTFGRILKKDYDRLKEMYPRQCKAVEESLKRLSDIEKDENSIPDDAVNCSGQMLAELFVFKDDFWAKTLRSFGYELGRFIYLMDVALDYEDDIKKGNYNPLIRLNKKPEEMEEILSMTIGNAVALYEKLPIVQDEQILSNVLYRGVWQQYYAKVIGKEEKNDKRPV